MAEYNDKIKSSITTAILTFLGMWAVVINFINIFFEEEFYSSGSMLLVLVLVSGLFGVLMSFVKKNWTVLLAGLGIIGLIVWTQFDEIAGGCAYCVNMIIESFGQYFGVNMLYLDYTKAMLRDYDPALFCYTAVILVALISSFAISKRKLAFIPIIFVLASLFTPVVIEVFPSVFAMLLAIAYCIMLIIVMNARVKKGRSETMVETTAIVFGIAVMLVGGIVTLVSPEDEYEQNEFFPEFRSEVRLFITENIDNFKFIEGNQKITSTIGGGALGHVDSLQFSNEEVLKVTLPAVRDTIYIKGYIGAEYTSNHWKEPDNKDEELFEQLVKANYSPAGMVSRYLEGLGEAQTLTGLRGSMKIEQVSKLELFQFAPIYPVVSSDLAPDYDGVIEDIPKGTYIDYYSVPDAVFQVSTDYMKDIIGSSYYLNNLLYADYVYDNYMEVNTPIADELKAQWGKYPVDTAKDRYNVAYAIQTYLNNTCTYNTSPGKVPEGKDFVEYFLKETKEGYCTYFATSAVMMFRSAGIPARYVEGYCFNITGREDIVEYKSGYVYAGYGGERLMGYCEKMVLDSNAHAWVEFYIDGIGWVDFEVTPGNSEIGLSQENDSINMNPEQFDDEEPTTEEPTTEEPTSEGETTEADTSEGETTQPSSQDETTTNEITVNESSGNFQEGQIGPTGGEFKKLSGEVLRTILIILGIIFGGFLITFLIILRHKKATAAKEMFNNSEKQLDKLAIYEYMVFIRLMRHINLVKPDYMTNLEYAEYVAKATELVDEEVTYAIAKMQEKAEYAKDLLTAEEISKCREYNNEIRDRIYERQNFIQKLIFKYILNL